MDWGLYDTIFYINLYMDRGLYDTIFYDYFMYVYMTNPSYFSQCFHMTKICLGLAIGGRRRRFVRCVGRVKPITLSSVIVFLLSS